MQSISGINSGAAKPSVPIADVDEPKKVRRPEDETQLRHQKPVMDEYVPEENRNQQGVTGWAKTRTESLKSISMTQSGQRIPRCFRFLWSGQKCKRTGKKRL